MKRIISVFLAISAMINVSLAEETAFRGVKLADAKGKQADASLVFSDNNKNVVVSGGTLAMANFSDTVHGVQLASGTITGFKVSQDGRLTLLNANAITAAPGGKPLDMAFSENNQYLYVFNATQLRLNTYRVQADGSLVWLGDMAGFATTPTATGIAAR